jgi:hypothetical protein
MLRMGFGGDTSPMTWLLRSNLRLPCGNLFRAWKMGSKNAGLAGFQVTVR